MNFKIFNKMFATALMVAVAGFCACADGPAEGDGGGSKPSDKLEVVLGADNYEVQAGSQVVIPFTVTGVAGSELAYEAKTNNSECKVEIEMDEFVGNRLIFSAPKISTEDFEAIVLLTVKDVTYNRDNATARATVKVSKSETLAVAFQSVTRSIAVMAGETISLPVVVSGVGAATLNAPSVTVAEGWSGSWEWTDQTKGFANVNLTAPATLGENVTLSVTITDDFEREAKLDANLDIVAITIAKDAANCHIVKPGETLTINAVKGNSAETLEFNNATLVWQDALGMVKSVSANANEGVVVVELNDAIEGNAVVAAKQDDTIVWSWHVWVTAYEPNAEENVMAYDWAKRNAEGEVTETGTTYWMDRNLGARNATMFDAGALGLFYQWGRKDPFVGADGVESSVYVKKYDIDGNQIHEVSKLRPTYPEDDRISTNLELAIQNPTIFYYAPSSAWPVVDWLTDDSARQNNDLWAYEPNAEENVMAYDWAKRNAEGEVTETGTTYWMDRNLGARNATMFDAGALGLFYQWGRKDPFVGADGVESSVYVKKYDIDGNQIHEVSKLRPTYPEDDRISTNLELAIQNPTIFYYAPSSAWPVVDWLTDDSARQNNDLWGGVSGRKTIYDPCPYGWKVPVAGAPWSFRSRYKKEGNLNDSKPYDPTQPWYIYWDLDKCIGFRYQAPGTEKEWWFPFTGKKEPNDGTLTGVGGGANYHTATTSNTTALMEIMAWGNPTSETGLNRTYGSSVRCVKDSNVE